VKFGGMKIFLRVVNDLSEDDHSGDRSAKPARLRRRGRQHLFAFPPMAVANWKPCNRPSPHDPCIEFGSRRQNAPARRTVLQRLLLEEVRKFGLKAAQLSIVYRQISDPVSAFERRRSLFKRLRIEGHDTRRAEGLLSNLVGMQEIFEQHRRAILDSTQTVS
jgi:hypothetical protein